MKPKKMPSPIRVKAVAKPIMITTTMSAEHQEPEGGIAHILLSPAPMPRCRAASSICAARAIAAWRSHRRHARSERSCSSTTSISLTSFSRDGQAPVLQADDAAHHLGKALQQHQGAGDRDDGLEMVDRRAVGGDVGMLADAPRIAGIFPAGIEQGADAGEEEDEVEHQVEQRLGARPHRAVEEVAAHMGVLRQRIGAAQHEQRAVEHVVEVEDPGRRRVEQVALEDLQADHRHQGDDQPGGGLADPGADAVDGVEEAFDRHAVHYSAKQARHRPVCQAVPRDSRPMRPRA